MRLPAIVVVALVLSVCAAARSQQESNYRRQQMRMAELHVTRVVEPWLRTHHVPGAVVSLVSGDRTLAMQGFGLADTGRGTAVTPTGSVFRVGSLVRALTATATLQLVDRGVFDLNTDLIRSIDSKSLQNDAFGPLTATQLLLHTGGIDQRWVATRAQTVDDLMDLATYLERRMPARVREPDVVSIPSNHGYALLGRVLETASGQTFNTYMDQALLSPLGMSNTWIDPRSLPAGRIATGYERRLGQLSAVTLDFAQTTPASSLWTTADDMTKWMRMILSNGEFESRRVLSAASTATLLEPQFSTHEALPGRTLVFQEGYTLPSGELTLESTSDGFSSIIGILPHRRVGLFIALNIEVDLRGLVREILEPLDSAAIAEQEPVAAKQAIDVAEWTGIWRDTSVPLASAEKLVSLVRQDPIRDTADGTLVWRSKLFVPSTFPCFQEQETRLRLCFLEGEGSTRFATVGGDLLMEKISWYESRSVQLTLWIVFAALFLAAGWPRVPLPTRQTSLDPEDAYPPRWPTTLARLAACFHFVFIALLVGVVAYHLRSGASRLLYEVPFYVFAILTLPLLAALLTLAAATGVLPVWRNPRSTQGSRLRLIGLLLILLAFLPFLWSWNLLGFHI